MVSKNFINAFNARQNQIYIRDENENGIIEDGEAIVQNDFAHYRAGDTIRFDDPYFALLREAIDFQAFNHITAQDQFTVHVNFDYDQYFNFSPSGCHGYDSIFETEMVSIDMVLLQSGWLMVEGFTASEALGNFYRNPTEFKQDQQVLYFHPKLGEAYILTKDPYSTFYKIKKVSFDPEHVLKAQSMGVYFFEEYSLEEIRSCYFSDAPESYNFEKNFNNHLTAAQKQLANSFFRQMDFSDEIQPGLAANMSASFLFLFDL